MHAGAIRRSTGFCPVKELGLRKVDLRKGDRLAVTIQRAGETPPFVELPLRFVVADSTLGPPSPAVVALNPTPISIPSFQRGIEWGEEQVSELLESTAVLYGTVILGSFPNQPQILIDGLQRFATTTAILYSLHAPVLKPNPENQAASPYFQRLKARVAYYHPIVEFNVRALSNHKRRAIKDSFLRLLLAVDSLVTAELSPGSAQAFGSRVETMLLDRQVAIDPYFNFSSTSQMTGTFVNLNTAGVELSPVDLLRSRVVDQASRLPWSARDIALIEDQFTDVFEVAGLKGYMGAMAKVLDALVSDSQTVGCIFPNWSRLSIGEVVALLDFIEAMVTAGQFGNSGYVRELFRTTPAVFALTTLYWYRESLSGTPTPSFLPGGAVSADQDLHLLLRAVYRRIIDGTVFRIGDMVPGIIGSGPLPRIVQVADQINLQNPGGPLTSAPNRAWLAQRLSEVDGTMARRVFNACLLPPRNMAGGVFAPLDFGRRTVQWTIDHLIPSSQISQNTPGESESDTIVNFAPLIMQNNRQALAMPCSEKLGPNGPYGRAVSQPTGQHPYVVWLTNTHYPAHSAALNRLDDPAELILDRPGSVGHERVEELCNLLANTL